MYCKWCGMDSKDNQRCEWCGRPFVTPTGPQATTAVPPAPEKTQQAPVPPPVYTRNQQAAPPAYRPQPETDAAPVNRPSVDVAPPVYRPSAEEEAPPSPMYAGSAVQNTTSMLPQTTVAMNPQQTIAMPPQPDTYTGATDPRARAAQRAADYGDDAAVTTILPFGDRMERYLGIMLPLMALAMVFSHQYTSLWVLPLLFLLFPAGMLMGSFRVIGYFDEEYADAVMLLAFSAFFGPIYGTAIYALVAAVRRDINYSMMGLLASYFVLLLFIGGAAGGVEEIVTYMIYPRIALDPVSWAIQIFPLTLLFGGWMCASFTRPLNEN